MTTNRLGLLLFFLAALGFALAGCGGGGGGGTVPDGGGDPGGGDPGGGDPGGGDPSAPTHDASGDWIFVAYQMTTLLPAETSPDTIVRVTVVQTGSQVTATPVGGGAVYAGTVTGPDYAISHNFPSGGRVRNEQISFTLSTANEGFGIVNWSMAGAGGVAMGDGQFVALRVLPATFGANGTWLATVATGFSDPPGNENPGVANQPVSLTQTGNEMTLDVGDGGPAYTGYVTGAHYWLSRIFAEDPYQRSDLIRFDLGSANSGTGNIYWKRWNDVERVVGEDGLSISK